MNMIRKALLATAFLATVAGTLAGAAFQGETKEFDMATTCETAAWPMIPAACLTNSNGQDVRFVSADNLNLSNEMDHRFSVAFQ